MISTPGNYRIKLNLSTLVLKLRIWAERWIYPNLWMIGSATTGGWSLDDATKMTPIADERNGFVWEGEA